MTKEVLVSISGLQIDVLEEENENEPIEIVSPASYYCRNGKHYVIYDEVTEGVPGNTRNKIKITGDSMLELTKSGVMNVHMSFEKNKKTLTYYQTPFGQLLLGIHTTGMEVEEAEENINIRVNYMLDVNHEPLADCEIKMNIKARGAKDFSLAERMDF